MRLCFALIQNNSSITLLENTVELRYRDTWIRRHSGIHDAFSKFQL